MNFYSFRGLSVNRGLYRWALAKPVVRFLGLAVFAFFFLICSKVFGDGCYISEKAVRGIPEISGQQAIVCWKDGRETLVISSALDSESQKLGWIIPLPNVPEVIEKQSPGALKTLDFCLQPAITHDLHGGLRGALAMAILANMILGTALFKKEYLVSLLVALILILIFFSLLLPAVSASGNAARSRMASVEKSVAAGAYDIRILKASKFAELNDWLGENGLAKLPDAAEKIVDGYAARGWVFAAIQLTREEAGANAPHPIKMQFASEEAVYPMKLTALAGGNPRFEIFVIADQKASCPALAEEFCDRFARESENGSDEYDSDEKFSSKIETKSPFKGENFPSTIGHSALRALMWDQCVLTQFSGEIRAAAMTDDLHFAWIPFESFRKHFFTTRGASESAFALFLVVAGAWLFISMLFFREKIKQANGLKKYLGYVITPAIAVIALGAIVFYAMVPKLNDSEVHTGRHWQKEPYMLHYEVRSFLEDRPTLLEKSNEEITEVILKYLKSQSYMGNEITGQELKAEDSPGNFTVEREEAKVVIRFYDSDGSVMAIRTRGE